MNKIDKMRRTQRKARKYLEEEGFDFIHIIQHTRWSKDIVIDGAAFDGFALKKGLIKKIVFKSGRRKTIYKNPVGIVFLQFKTNSIPPKQQIENYKRVAEKYGFGVYIMSWYDRKGWKIIKLGDVEKANKLRRR